MFGYTRTSIYVWRVWVKLSNKKTEDAGGEWAKPPTLDCIISNGVQSKI